MTKLVLCKTMANCRAMCKQIRARVGQEYNVEPIFVISTREEVLGRTENVGSSNKPYGQFPLKASEAKIDGCREASDNSGQSESSARITHKEEPI